MTGTNLCDYTGFEGFPQIQIDSALCEYAPSCKIYERAEQILDKRRPTGDLEDATLRIGDTCLNEAIRKGKSCYREFQKTDVKAFMSFGADFIPDTKITIPWDSELPRPPENTEIALMNSSVGGLVAVDQTTGQGFNLVYNDKTSKYFWRPLGMVA